MVYALWIVVGLIALDVLAGLIQAIVKGSFSSSTLAGFLQTGILSTVLPLLVLKQLVSQDPTGWVVVTLFYIGAIGAIIKSVKDIIDRF